MRKYKSTIIGLLVSATVALAFIQIDDTHVQTILTGAIKTFQDAIHFQATGGGTNYVGIVAPATVPTPVVFKLPGSDGTSGQAVVTDGSANLSFASISGSVPTATPLVFGTPGVIPVFASPELGSYAGSVCPTPQTATAIDASGALTCSAVACPAGSTTDVQYNLSGACAGDAGFTYDSTTAGFIPFVTIRGTTTNPATLQVINTDNAGGAGAHIILSSAGASANADTLVSFDRGLGSGGVGRYLNMGIDQSNGLFSLIDNSSSADAHTGTRVFSIARGTNNFFTEFYEGSGTSTAPALRFINNTTTGWSFTAPGGAQAEIDTIAHGNLITHHTWLTGSSGVFGVDARTVLTPKVDNSVSGAGPVQETCDTSLLELKTSNGAGTAIVLTLTNSQEGQVCRVMNLGSNDLTFATTSSGSAYDQITTASAVQTLSNEGDTIEFISHLDSGTGAQRWYQSQAVAGP